MESIWQQNTKPLRFAPLETNACTDVLIIGGGIAGVLCAYMLKTVGIDCLLVEAADVFGGTTGYTTAKITLLHGLLYDKLIRTYGEEYARGYLCAQRRAEETYARLCRDIDCDYEHQDAYVYSINDRRAVEEETEALRILGIDAELSVAPSLPMEIAAAVRVKGEAQFHPLKFLYGIARDLPIRERTKVLELSPHKATTRHGEIQFNKVIVATHFPLLNKHGGYFLKMYQHRSYVLALEGASPLEGMYVDESHTGLSFRYAGDRLLLGGGGHRTGKQGGCWQELERFARTHYKGATIVGKWAAQDCMTLDGVPYIGQYCENTPDMFVATGFNKWGITNAMVAAQILCDEITGEQNSYAKVFSPSRSIWHPQLLVNMLESTVGLLTPTTPRCPHLGCALKYNRAEHSWDCPCHGSRFTESGKLINNPATDDKQNMPGR